MWREGKGDERERKRTEHGLKQFGEATKRDTPGKE